MNLRRLKGFTLIELLVVVAIIALLIGILMPALRKARESARTTRCQANLHSIGQGIKAYSTDHHDYFPPMAGVPTVELTFPQQGRRVPMNVLLGPYMGGTSVVAGDWGNPGNKWNDKKNLYEVFHCPADRIENTSSVTLLQGTIDSPGDKTTYFEWQGSSYEPLPGLGEYMGGKWSLTQENRLSTLLSQLAGQNGYSTDSGYVIPKLPIIFDFETFHPKTNAGALAGKMVLYGDFHVDQGKDIF